MGYRFSLNHANVVAHLVQGNVATFLDETLSSNEILQPNIEFVHRFVTYTEEVWFTSRQYRTTQMPRIEWLRDRWSDVKGEMLALVEANSEERSSLKHPVLLEFFKVLSGMLTRCSIKTLLLPGFGSSPLDLQMTQVDLLRRIVEIHPGRSALILQPTDLPARQGISILNTFPGFETAYRNLDQWPGILAWNGAESVFVAVRKEEDIFTIYKILKFEKDGLDYLRKLSQSRLIRKEYAYFFHISDLHFGNAECNRRKSRLTALLESHLREVNDCDKAVPVITGDLLETPNHVNLDSYSDFREALLGKGFENPIHILGNHDTAARGLLEVQRERRDIATSLSVSNKIEVLPEVGVAFVKWDSTTGGALAQGEIGEPQLIRVGNELDSIAHKEQLTFIALLHHHPMKIPRPDWYAKNWYEKLFGDTTNEAAMKLIDAERFLAWIEARNIKMILHGHKHIPFIQTHNNITIIAAGSSTGRVRHVVRDKTFLSFNVVKYDVDSRKPVSCAIVVEEILGAGARNMLVSLL